MFLVRGVFRNFFRKEHQIFSLFQAQFFPTELFLSKLSNKINSGGFGGMIFRKIFENLHTVMAILVLFEQFSGKFLNYFAP